MVMVSGISMEVDGISIKELLIQLNYKEDRVAVEKNENIIPKSNYASEILKDGDVLEIVSFVGGG